MSDQPSDRLRHRPTHPTGCRCVDCYEADPQHPAGCRCLVCYRVEVRAAWANLRAVFLAEPPMPRIVAALDRFTAWLNAKLVATGWFS